MVKDLTKKGKTRRRPSLSTDRERCSSSTQQSIAPVMDRKTEASHEKTPQERTRVSEMAELYGTVKHGGRMPRGNKRVKEKDELPPDRTTKWRRLLFDEESAADGNGTDNPLEGCSTLLNDMTEDGRKKKADDAESQCRKRKRKSPDLLETTTETKDSVSVDAQRAQFEAKYVQQNQLGEGGCGSVFAGYRKSDNVPVAIKHIPQDKVYCKEMNNNGKEISVEVAIMLSLAAKTTRSKEKPVPISLLDWYDLDQELILVLERPVPCEDLFKYIENNGGILQEDVAKVILKQLVDAATELHVMHIFHRDIKIENILIETDSDIPRVRLIDFGLSCFFKKRSRYRIFYGTPVHMPPEFNNRYTYWAGPTTVWQMGVVLFEMLHRNVKFETTKFLKNRLKISNSLSKDCKDVLQMCLTKVPEQRPTLEELQRHPWFR